MSILSPFCRRIYSLLCSGVCISTWLFFTLVFPLDLLGQEDFVRVRLLREFNPRTVVVSSSRSMQLYSGDLSNPILELMPREKLTLTTSNERVYLRTNEGGIFASSLIISQPEDAELTLEIAEGNTIPPPRRYHGFFLIQVDNSMPSTLQILNEVPLEKYVTSVLASEFNFPELEASKALAISIRTLTLRNIVRQNGPIYAVPDDESWQVYRGIEPITRTAIEATAETYGDVLLFNNELAETVYFASSGGHTANNEDVWDASEIQPYLRGKEDPYDYDSPHHNWETTISRTQLLQTLSEAYKFDVTEISVQNRSRDGRAKTMLLKGPNNQQKSVPGNEFRRVVTEQFGRESLKSTLFELNAQPDLFIFIGKGFGHGVGLNQWGALELSRRGQLHHEILDYYYVGTEIGNYDVNRSLIAQSPHSDLSSNIPVIEFGTPTRIESSPVAQEVSQSSDFSASSRLFGDDFDEESETSLETQSVVENDVSDVEREKSSVQRQLPPGSKVVGWTKTTRPVSAAANADSTKKKRRRGW